MVDLLADRAEAETRSLLAVVLNDAVAIAPRLTDAEIAILSLHWKLTSVRSTRAGNIEGLREYLETEIVPLIPLIPMGRASYLHLQALGCAAVAHIGEISFHVLWSEFYGGLFNRGFAPDQLSESFVAELSKHSLLIPCLQDPARLQLGFQNKDILDARVSELPLSHLKEEIDAIWAQNAMNESEVVEAVSNLHPAMPELANLWANTPLRQLNLSAVGIALAHANCRRLTGDEAPLSVWIN